MECRCPSRDCLNDEVEPDVGCSLIQETWSDSNGSALLQTCLNVELPSQYRTHRIECWSQFGGHGSGRSSVALFQDLGFRLGTLYQRFRIDRVSLSRDFSRVEGKRVPTTSGCVEPTCSSPSSVQGSPHEAPRVMRTERKRVTLKSMAVDRPRSYAGSGCRD